MTDIQPSKQFQKQFYFSIRLQLWTHAWYQMMVMNFCGGVERLYRIYYTVCFQVTAHVRVGYWFLVITIWIHHKHFTQNNCWFCVSMSVIQWFGSIKSLNLVVDSSDFEDYVSAPTCFLACPAPLHAMSHASTRLSPIACTECYDSLHFLANSCL